jgi:hypothetical protein
MVHPSLKRKVEVSGQKPVLRGIVCVVSVALRVSVFRESGSASTPPQQLTAITVWSGTVAVTRGEARRLLLVVVQVCADRWIVVCVTLLRVPRPLRLELQVPIAVGRVFQRLADRRVPRIR